MRFQVGTARVDITPEAGYLRNEWGGQQTLAVRTLRPLYAKVLVLQVGADHLALISLDLLSIDRDLTGRIRKRVQKSGISAESLLLSCSHTHEAPMYSDLISVFPTQGSLERKYNNFLVESVSRAVALATDSLTPANLSISEVDTLGKLNRNRRRPQQKVDTTLRVLRVDRVDGNKLAVVWHFGAHPLTRYSDTGCWSSDFPGLASAMIEEQFPGVQCQFLQGGSGDVFPLDWYFDAPTPIHSVGLESEEAMGESLAEHIAAALESTSPVSGPFRAIRTAIQLSARTVSWTPAEANTLAQGLLARVRRMPFQPWRPEDHVCTNAQKHPIRYEAIAAQSAKKLAESVGRSYACEISLVRIGSLILVAIPGELFSQLGLAIQCHWPESQTWVLTNTNGYVGYIPTSKDAEEVSNWTLGEFVDQKTNRWAYGATITTAVADDSGEKILDTVRGLIDRIREE
jgi:hypothetical protein